MLAPGDAEQNNHRCFRCGYLLQGIAAGARCPECGLFADFSRHRSRELIDAHPRWLRRVRFGVLLLIVSLTLPAVWTACRSFIAAPPGVLVATATRRYRIAAMPRPSVATLRSMAAARPEPMLWPILASLILAGVWFTTTPEGYSPTDYFTRRRRSGSRLCALLLLTTTSESLLCEWLTPGSEFVMGQWLWGAMLLGPAVPLAGLMGLMLRHLALRSHAVRLAEWCLLTFSSATAALLMVAVLNQSRQVSVLAVTQQWSLPEQGPAVPIVVGVAMLLTVYGCCFGVLVWFAAFLTGVRRAQQLRWKQCDGIDR